jgi:hypothetical protein
MPTPRTQRSKQRLKNPAARAPNRASGSVVTKPSPRTSAELRTLQSVAQMALHQTTTSNLVNALTSRKLIRRVRDDADQRIVHLHASAQGKQLLLLTPGPHAGLLVDALRRLETR